VAVKRSKWLIKRLGKPLVEGGMAGGIPSMSIKGSEYSVKGWKDVASALQCMQAQCKHFSRVPALPFQQRPASDHNLVLLG